MSELIVVQDLITILQCVQSDAVVTVKDSTLIVHAAGDVDDWACRLDWTTEKLEAKGILGMLIPLSLGRHDDTEG